jgi:hypothetical protein
VCVCVCVLRLCAQTRDDVRDETATTSSRLTPRALHRKRSAHDPAPPPAPQVTVLHGGISGVVASGEMMALMGPSGAGESGEHLAMVATHSTPLPHAPPSCPRPQQAHSLTRHTSAHRQDDAAGHPGGAEDGGACDRPRCMHLGPPALGLRHPGPWVGGSNSAHPTAAYAQPAAEHKQAPCAPPDPPSSPSPIAMGRTTSTYRRSPCARRCCSPRGCAWLRRCVAHAHLPPVYVHEGLGTDAMLVCRHV